MTKLFYVFYMLAILSKPSYSHSIVAGGLDVISDTIKSKALNIFI